MLSAFVQWRYGKFSDVSNSSVEFEGCLDWVL